MNVIAEIYKNKKVNIQKLADHGFMKNGSDFVFSQKLPQSGFVMNVTVTPRGEVSAEVIDPAADEPYTLHLAEAAAGGFVGGVRFDYESILEDIAAKCFEVDVFKSEQAKELIAYVREVYGDELEFLWEKFPENAVWRRKDTGKWYGALLTVSKRKLGIKLSDKAEIIDLRAVPEVLERLIDNKKYFAGYHMNKKHWYTIILDGSVPTEEILDRIEGSYLLAKKEIGKIWYNPKNVPMLLDIEHFEVTKMRKYYEAYDERYKTAHSKGVSWLSDRSTPIVLDIIRKYNVGKSDTILEIGCGEGRDSKAVLESGYKLFAADISAEAIEYCQKTLPLFKAHFAVLDCLNGKHQNKYDFIYSVAVIHMLVSDEDRNRFYGFIREHLSENGAALICSMGDGVSEMRTDPNAAFELREREHKSGKMTVAATSCRTVSFETFESEITSNGLVLLEKGITAAPPDFDSLMFAVVKQKNGV